MNINLITSISTRLSDIEIKKIVKDNNYLTLNMLKDDFSSLMEEISYSFFLDDIKYIVVKNLLNNIKEKQEESLINYLNKPNEKVVLIFAEEKVDGRKKIIKQIKKNSNYINIVVDYKTSPTVYDLVNSYISSNGYKSDFKVAGYLVSIFNLNIDLIYNELDKVFLYYTEKVYLTVDNIRDIVSTMLVQSSFKFTDCVINKDLSGALDILDDLKINKTDPSMLIIILYKEYRNLYFVKEYSSKKMSQIEISSKLKMENWQIQKYFKMALNYKSAEIIEIIKKIGYLDKDVKTGRVDKLSGLEYLLIDIIV